MLVRRNAVPTAAWERRRTASTAPAALRRTVRKASQAPRAMRASSRTELAALRAVVPVAAQVREPGKTCAYIRSDPAVPEAARVARSLPARRMLRSRCLASSELAVAERGRMAPAIQKRA